MPAGYESSGPVSTESTSDSPNASIPSFEEVLASERAELRASRNLPLIEHILELANGLDIKSDDAWNLFYVHVAFDVPVPWHIASSSQEILPDDVTSLAAYAELDNGYPLVFKVPPDADLSDVFITTLDLLASRAAEAVDSPAGLAPYPTDIAEAIANVRAHAESRLVLLGYSVPAGSLREAGYAGLPFSDHIVGVAISPQASFVPVKPSDEIYDVEAVKAFGTVWIARVIP